MFYAKLFSLITVLILIIYVYLKRKHSYWKRKGVKQLKPNLIFGNFGEMLTGKMNEAEICNKFYKNMDNVNHYVGIYNFLKPILIVKDLKLITRILITDFDHFVNYPDIFSDCRDSDKVILSLFLMKDSLWKSRRTLFSHHFTPGKIKIFFDVVKETSEEISLDSEIDIQIETVIKRYIAQNIMQTLFNIKQDSIENPNSEFMKYGDASLTYSTWSSLKILLYNISPTLFKLLKLQVFPDGIYKFFQRFSKDVIESRKKQNVSYNDMFSLMIDKIPDEEITSHVYTFFEAGYDSSSMTISHTLYHLSRDQQKQEKLRDEITNALKFCDNNITYDALNSMKYLNQVIKETLRMYPSLAFLKKECQKDYLVEETGLIIEKGTSVWIPALGFHYDPIYFHEPYEFKPERFQDGSHRNASYYLPFGRGPRECIGIDIFKDEYLLNIIDFINTNFNIILGRKLGELMIKLSLINIIRKYEIAPSNKNLSPRRYDPKSSFLINRPIGGIWIKTKRINL